MSDSFDPYYIWLGIPPRDQPPNHYRLLGLQDLEENTDVIDAAANRQTTYLHEMAAGPKRKESQQLLNEVAAARRCLLNPEKKNEYDEKLRADAAAKAAQAAVASPVVPPPAAVPVARAVSPATPPGDSNTDSATEIPNFNFGDDAAPVVDNGALDFPILGTQSKKPAVTIAQSSDADVANQSDDETESTQKKPVPKQWIIAGCSIAVVAVVAFVFSGESDQKRKSRPTQTTTKLDSSGTAVTTVVEAASTDDPDSSAASNENLPKKKPSLFDQINDQDTLFKAPTNFGGKEKKKKK